MIEEKFSSAYSNKGILLLRLERFEEARETFDKALELEPENALYLINSCRCNLGLGLKNRDLRLIADEAVCQAFYAEKIILENGEKVNLYLTVDNKMYF
jgi:tetratricopeptide (TPR) repeat protein